MTFSTNSTTWLAWASAPNRSATCSRSAAPLTPLNVSTESSSPCLISRLVWVVQDQDGRFLDQNGLWTERLEWAWWPLDPDAAASRLQQLGIDLRTCRLIPVTLQAHPAAPWAWRVDG